MTRDSYELIQRLKECQMPAGSFDRRFILDLAKKSTDYSLSDRQQFHLKQMAFKYRTQLAAKGVIVEVVNG